MSYENLRERQKQEWKQFYADRESTKAKIVEKHHGFCKPYYDSKQPIPEKLKKQIKGELGSWLEEWGEKGLREKALNEAQKKERKEFAKEHPLEIHMAEVRQNKVFERDR